jgi:hypothetical protein
MRGWIVVVVLLLAGCATQSRLGVVVAREPDADAWWLRTQLEPGGRSVRGIPVDQFDAGWCAADEITTTPFPAAIRSSGPWPLDGKDGEAGPAFSLSGTFSADEPMEVFLGAYRTCAGESRNFVAVLAPQRGQGDERIVQVETVSAGKAVFLHLSPDAGGTGFRIYSCLACDDMGQHYLWSAASGKFERQPYVDETG